MSILSDITIRDLAINHNMISPFIDSQVKAPGTISYGLSSFGYDICCSHDFYIYDFHELYSPQPIDPLDFKKVELGVEVNCQDRGYIYLQKGNYALTHSIEYIKMPEDVLAIVIGKSTYARCGLHINVTPLEPGWEGQITLELGNETQRPIKIYGGQGIAQLLFFRGDMRPKEVYDSLRKYQGQLGIVYPRVYQAAVVAEKGNDNHG